MATVQTIIDQARRYVDDSHKATDGWKQPADWLALAQPELMICYRKWVREGLISLQYAEISFTGPTTNFNPSVTVGTITPLAIIGVVQSLGNGMFRPLQSGMAQLGRAAFWDGPAGISGVSTYWTAGFTTFSTVATGFTTLGTVGAYNLFLHPPDASTYIVRFLPEPNISALTSVVYLPTGLDDYVSLRLARKALASEGASSQAIERLIVSAEAEWKMLSLGGMLGDAPKVRIVKPFNRFSYGLRDGYTTNPYYWYYT